jgi:deazaflavin-dependent oxidoreductase (nitroreductase family)
VVQATLTHRGPTLIVTSMRPPGAAAQARPAVEPAVGMNPREVAVEVADGSAAAGKRKARLDQAVDQDAAEKDEGAGMSDWNNKVIEEFRANEGKVGGPFEGAPVLLLHTVGARTGQERVNPMMYQHVDGGYAVFASKGGAPSNPDWYHNLLAHPKVTAEIGTSTVELITRVAEGDERERIWTVQKAAYPGFADYERKTTRQIPVIILEPAH